MTYRGARSTFRKHSWAARIVFLQAGARVARSQDSGTLLADIGSARTGRRSLGLLLALRAVSAPGPHAFPQLISMLAGRWVRSDRGARSSCPLSRSTKKSGPQ